MTRENHRKAASLRGGLFCVFPGEEVAGQGTGNGTADVGRLTTS